MMPTPRVLLVDDNENVRITLQQALEINDFEVVAASGVNDALRHIGAERFDVLLSDLHMPGPGDGLTVVGAMRHANPHAITLVYSGYPEMRAAAAAILLQADEILIKPLSVPDLVEIIRKKLISRTQPNVRVTESVANILETDREKIIQQWMTRVEGNKDLMGIPLSTQERTLHLPQLLKDLVTRLRRLQIVDGTHTDSKAAHEHGSLRRMQGYSAPQIVEESRMLQVSIFETLQNNLARVDFSLVLVDVMTIADEVDSQLCQAMQSFTGPTTVGLTAA
jgi:ActR/RegA family two-component response regulator